MVYTRGSRGSVVRQIQARLQAQVTGVWDTATARRVAKFQSDNNLKATGDVDAETYNLLFPTKPTPIHHVLEDFKQTIAPPPAEEVVIKKPTNKTKSNELR